MHCDDYGNVGVIQNEHNHVVTFDVLHRNNYILLSDMLI